MGGDGVIGSVAVTVIHSRQFDITLKHISSNVSGLLRLFGFNVVVPESR